MKESRLDNIKKRVNQARRNEVRDEAMEYKLSLADRKRPAQDQFGYKTPKWIKEMEQGRSSNPIKIKW